MIPGKAFGQAERPTIVCLLSLNADWPHCVAFLQCTPFDCVTTAPAGRCMRAPSDPAGLASWPQETCDLNGKGRMSSGGTFVLGNIQWLSVQWGNVCRTFRTWWLPKRRSRSARRQRRRRARPRSRRSSSSSRGPLWVGLFRPRVLSCSALGCLGPGRNVVAWLCFYATACPSLIPIWQISATAF